MISDCKEESAHGVVGLIHKALRPLFSRAFSTGGAAGPLQIEQKYIDKASIQGENDDISKRFMLQTRNKDARLRENRHLG